MGYWHGLGRALLVARALVVAVGGGALGLCLRPVPSHDPAMLADPAANVAVPGYMATACALGPTLACQAASARAIDAARADEGVAPLQLPSGFYTMPPIVQLLVVANAERSDRGLPRFVGLSASLDRLASAGARQRVDPGGPPGVSWGSNLAIGYTSVLQADYAWMYDDGPGADNGDCTPRVRTGCWGHRENILAGYGPRPLMGAAVVPTTFLGQPSVSMTELFAAR